ncbi:Glycosyltransferase involved in cell wall bisynthesis [Variovorax sp. EL159]|nr:Glycosyltransferase involved in cell wall bisynthesis [Variovorax sp. EL159]
MVGLDSLRRNARKLSKLAYWLLTPWRLPERLHLFREGLAREAKARALASLIQQERLRLGAIRTDGGTLPPFEFDLYSVGDVLAASGQSRSRLYWPLQDAGQVKDLQTAARFCIDLLRDRQDLRARFPRALSAPVEGGFAEWLQSDGAQQELGLPEEARSSLRVLFSSDFAARARQSFLTSEQIRAILPYGLTPVGRRRLFTWFMQHGRRDAGLQLEEVWWLFMQAAEDPQAELVRAYLFTPDWQQRFPDALTIFGWDRFSIWFAESFGANGAWTSPTAAPEVHAPASQILLAYWTREAWRAAHPRALSGVAAAKAMLEWLASSPLARLTPVARQWCAELDFANVAAELIRPRTNIIGHFCYPSGLRVSVEAMTEALELTGIATSLRDVRTDARDDPCHIRFDGMEKGDITIIHAQPEPFFAEVYARADLAQRAPRPYRIAYWYWEFDAIPESWRAHTEQIDEVWTATEFIAHGLRQRLSVPVRTLFPGVKLAPFEVRERAHFNLASDRFTFLFTFHMMSVMERKNPLGLIRAFKLAFAADEKVALVLKTSFGDRHPVQLQELRAAAVGAPITIIDQVFSPDEVLSLMNASDAYVSLHRSEGLGLTMAEAMLMGKPVIATGFSGNMDFMNSENSLLVSFERVKLGTSIPPYGADQEWAEPSVDQAAQYMRRLYENPEWAREIGIRGQRSAVRNLSLESAGRRFADRLAEIRLGRQVSSP